MDIKSVEFEIIKARKTFEKFGENIDSCRFKKFPTGCCGDASDILGKWLSSNGVVGLKYVHGCREEVSHGWLELNGVIIDITSDQFADGCGAVFFDANSDFHSSFKSQKKSEIGMLPILAAAYSKFSAYMKAV